jgi:hypothetical protein
MKGRCNVNINKGSVIMRKFYMWNIMVIMVFGLIMSSAYAVTPSGTTKVARVTGETPVGETLPNPNNTHTNYQVHATDLGTMWDAGNGEIMIAFGDTYGEGWGGSGAGPSDADWRYNVLAKSTDTDPTDGLTISTMIQDTPGHAKQLLDKDPSVSEHTVIPTAGVTVGSRHYMHYMSVNRWGNPGEWFTNYSGIAYSDDNGENWTKDANTKWINSSTWDNNFQMAAFVKDGGYVYMFATENGRFGDVYLARVPEGSMLTKSDYEYWDGSTWQINNEGVAKPIIKGPAGELSVQYNSYYGRWLITYLDEDRYALVLRDSASLTGPWTGEKVLATGSEYPQLYGAYIHPWFNDGPDIYFNMTQWDPYNVFFMHAALNLDNLGENILSDPGFEDQTTDTVSAPWYLEGNGGIDRGLGFAHSGDNNAWVRSKRGWNAVKQQIAVSPNTNYTITAWVRTSTNNNAGYLGAKVPGNNGAILNEIKYGSYSSYSQLTVTFNSGSNSIVEIYNGMQPPIGQDTWVQMDDFSVTKN